MWGSLIMWDIKAIVVISYITIMGILLGSFFNVMVLRALKGEGWVKGKSHCDKCGHTLHTLDLIPLFSYLFLRGKCRYCKSPISYTHILSEVMFGVAFLIVSLTCNSDILTFIVNIIVVTVLGINVISDLKERVTLTLTIYLGSFIIVILRFLTILNNFGWHLSLIYIIKALLLGLTLCIVSKLLQGKMGDGDFDILFMFYVANGMNYVFYPMFLGSVVGLIVLIPSMVLGKTNRKSELPFVPILFIGYLLSLVFIGG